METPSSSKEGTTGRELVGRLLRLPFRGLAYSAALMAASLRAVLQAVDMGADRFLGRPPVGLTGTVAPPGRASPGNPTVGTSERKRGARSGAANTNRANAPKEDRSMSYDQDLSGDDYKVVQYALVNVSPYIEHDQNRLVDGYPKTIVVSDDMTAGDFSTWITAREFQEHPGLKEKLHHRDKKYLRVAFSVMARFAKEKGDFDREQAAAIKHISRTLDERLPRQGKAAGK